MSTISASDLKFGEVRIGGNPKDRRRYFVCLLGRGGSPRMGIVYAAPNGIFGSGFDAFDKSIGLWFPIERSTLAALWGVMRGMLVERIVGDHRLWRTAPWYSVRELRFSLDREVAAGYPTWATGIDGHERGTAEAEAALLARTSELVDSVVEEAVRRGLIELDGQYVKPPRAKTQENS